MHLLDCLGKFLGLETTRTFSFLRILKTNYQGHICFKAEPVPARPRVHPAQNFSASWVLLSAQKTYGGATVIILL